MMLPGDAKLAWVRWVSRGVLLGASLALGLGCKAQEALPVQPARTASAPLAAETDPSGTPAAANRAEKLQLGRSSQPSDGQPTSTSSPVANMPAPLEAGAVPLSAAVLAQSTAAAKYAILVSVDGLAPRYLEELLRQGKAPTFAALQKLAAWTHDARTDKTHTITLPNHTSMITGLPVSPSAGFEAHRAHRYVENVDPLPGATLHPLRDQTHQYTPSMFDVAHDHGMTTAMFASKTKFSLYSQSYNDAGGPDEVGVDNGRKKIDTVVIDQDPTALVAAFIAALEADPPNLTFLHFGGPDAMGHGVGWGSPAYFAAVQQVDALLGRILTTIRSGALANKTALIITADHGGTGNHHADITDVKNFQIPFYVMAPGVASGDAYAAFKARFAPGPINPEYNAPQQPLRNGDSGNVALGILGLPQIPDSIIQSAGLTIN